MTAAEALAEARRAQGQASDPALNAFVVANAGSGKTKVLVDRVVRLLLAGARPDQILCLTYTKVAAGEMTRRLFEKLGGWSVLPDEALAGELQELAPEAALGGPQALRAARALFAQALETPGGLKVETIHAFCERLLRRFPLEAGVDPAFEVLDDAEAKRLAERARRGLAQALARDRALAAAYAYLAGAANDRQIQSLLDWAGRQREQARAQAAAPGGLEAAIAMLASKLHLPADMTEARAIEEAWLASPRDELPQAEADFRAGSPDDVKQAGRIAAACAAAAPAQAWAAYRDVALTTKDALRKRPVTQATLARSPLLRRLYGEEGRGGSEGARILEAQKRIAAAACLELSAAALRVAAAYAAAYEAEKRARAALDFGDLLIAADQLLAAAEDAQWVLYKLDGGVSHILLDEAQDTAPIQWEIIDKLTQEFFAGEGARGLARTMFAVGDEKQSIYSFQGADPARFLDQGRALEARARAAGRRFQGQTLAVSFRSAPNILKAVDAVFADAELREEVLPEREPPGPDPLRHVARRDDVEGLVELWPLIGAQEGVGENPDPWAPQDAAPESHPRVRLAETIAEAVRDWVARGEAVAARGRDGVWRKRAMTPGDVLILVRKRTSLFELILRHLKAKGVPVAGADRMTLKDQLAVEDVLCLARAGLLPEDDLALAELLKSPFLHPVGEPEPPIDEDALFRLAHGRPGRLALALRASDDPKLAEARALLPTLAADARAKTPYAFLAGLLERASPTGESYARRLYQRLGPEAEDPVEELLSRALAHEKRAAPSLERFLAETLAEGGQIKRDASDGGDAVRVMTVHAAKGGEAPVVILPDAGEQPGGGGDNAPFALPDGGLMWSLGASQAPPCVEKAREARWAARRAEDLRQLYVALTRAQDRLIIGGVETRARSGGSWHALIAKGLARAGATACDTPAGPDGLRLGAAPEPLPRRADPVSAPTTPDWARRPAPAAHLARPLTPSGLAAPGAAALSPLAEGAPDRFRRGVLIHLLLETLPDLAPREREAAALRRLAAEGLRDKDARALYREAKAVLDHKAFAPCFAPGSRAEVPIAGTAPGLPPGLVVNGRIDRLAVTAKEALVVDFKTNRPPPRRAEEVAEPYLVQMALYRALLGVIYPGRHVRCALAWTDGPVLMPLPDSLLDRALDRLRGSPYLAEQS